MGNKLHATVQYILKIKSMEMSKQLRKSKTTLTRHQ